LIDVLGELRASVPSQGVRTCQEEQGEKSMSEFEAEEKWEKQE
jgi:hypothetical protein